VKWAGRLVLLDRVALGLEDFESELCSAGLAPRKFLARLP
jgi:hypothetical protein